MYRLLFICLLLSFTQVSAQYETNMWYFGDRTGILFISNNTLPVALTDSKMYSHEGCASICSKTGSLLFYTNGEVVWNRDHDTMPNGRYLMGENSSTQSSLILPFPEDSNKYYIFTTQDVSKPNIVLSYSIVDITLDGGLGDVINDNYVLYDNVCEKLTATIKEDGTGYWVIVHEWGKNKFLSFSVTSNGVNTEPVESTAGINPSYKNISNKLGYMKASPDASMIAMATYVNPAFELFKFDNETGLVSDGIVLGTDNTFYKSYGIEFSPDCSKLYVSSYSNKSSIFQFDLNSVWEDIPGTIEIITQKDEYFGALQLGRDGKIYCASMDSSYLSVIVDPSADGSACNYMYKAVPLNRRCKSGLPNFLPDFICFPSVEIPDSIELCEGDEFTISSPFQSFARYSWEGPVNFSHNYNTITLKDCKPEHSGYYYLTATNGKKKAVDSTLVIVHPNPNPVILPSQNILLVEGYSCTVTTADKYASILWSTNETRDSIIIDKSGDYYVTVTDSNGCSQTAYFNVSYVIASVEFPDDEDFGKLVVGDRISKRFIIKNTGNVDILLSELNLLSSNGVFICNSGDLSLPHIIPPDKEAEFSVTFNPLEVKDYYDSLEINIDLLDHTGYASKTIYFTGSGLGSLKFFLPDTICNVYERKLIIPLYCEMSAMKTDYAGTLSYTVLISLDASILLPVDILNKSNIRETGIHEGRRYIEFSGKDIPVQYGLNILDYLKGEPRISRSLISSLKIESIVIPNFNYSYSGADGALEVYGICQPSLGRVKDFQPLKASIAPIPAVDYADLSIIGINNGDNIVVSVFNAQGQECKSIQIQVHGTHRIELSEFTTGIYNVIVKKGEQVRSIPLVVIR